MQILSALEHLTAASGPSGYEAGVATAVEELLQPLVDEVKRDALGNLIAYKQGTRPANGTRPKLMLAAHMDEIAMMVLKITEQGFLRVTPVGGVDLRLLPGQEVLVHGRKALPGVVGATPPHLTAPAERSKAPKWEDIYIDIGYQAETAETLVRPGDLITFCAPLTRLLGERVAGKSCDNRAGITVMCESLDRLQRQTHAVDILAVATVAEETGLRGAMTSAFHLMPQAGIAIDVGFGAMPGLTEHESIALGRGPAISIGGNIHPAMRDRLMQVAKAENIPVQTEVLPGSSGTDAWSMQVTQAGLPTALISLPLRYMHSSVECLDLQDLAAAGRLLAAFISGLDSAEVWGWANGLA